MEAAPVAHTTLGDLIGARGDGALCFRGVPYAAPPVGALRFAPPALHPGWQGLRDATRHGPVAPQARSRLAAAMGDFDAPQSEDCLTLTIATPGLDGPPRPVMVWLHGGAFISGAGSLDWYDGSALARTHGIVVVGVNYRLGALGWLVADGVSDGNLGLLDQIGALRWVRSHIASFGGDPECVTVAGQSAGAASIARLIADPVARGLFRRAILQSGGFGRPPSTRAAAAESGAAFLRMLDADPRTAAPAELLAAQGALARSRARFADTTPPFLPVIDAEASSDETARGLDVLIGATRDEMHAFFAADPAMRDPPPEAVAARWAELGGKARYRARRPGGTESDLLADAVGDRTFVWPSMRAAERMAAAGSQVFAYQFAWAPKLSPFRACHCIELPFVFATLAGWPGAAMLDGADSAQMTDLAAAMSADWARFVRDGTPGAHWPRYEAGRRATMVYADVVGVMGDPAGLGWRA